MSLDTRYEAPMSNYIAVEMGLGIYIAVGVCLFTHLECTPLMPNANRQPLCAVGTN